MAERRICRLMICASSVLGRARHIRITRRSKSFVRIFMCSLKSKFRSCSIYSVNYSIIRLSVSVIPLFNLPLFRHSVIQPSFVKRAFPICSEKGSFHSLYIIGKGTCPAHSVLLRKGIRRLSMFVMRFMQSLALGGTRCKGKSIFLMGNIKCDIYSVFF